MHGPHRRDLYGIAVLCLTLSGMIGLDIALNNSHYLLDGKNNSNPDGLHYIVLGRNLWLNGAFSRQEEPPHTPDMLRTPVYPVVVGALETTVGAWGLYALQALCRCAVAVAVYWVGASLFSRRVGLIAGLLLALDPMQAILDFEAMSESLFTFFVTLGVLFWLMDLFHPSAKTPRWWRGLLVGLLLGLGALTRPTGLYLPLILAGIQAVLALRRRSGAVVRHGLAMLLVFVAVLAPWIIRNSQVFGIARLTTADRLTFIYDTGAGAYVVEHRITMEEARDRIQREFGIVSVLDGNNPWQTGLDVKQTDAELKEVMYDVLLRYPRSLVISSTLGVLKSSLGHNVEVYAQMTGRDWQPPGMGNLLRGKAGEFSRGLFRNSAILVLIFVWEVVFAALVLLAAIVGLIRGLCVRSWRPAVLCVLLIAGYYALTIGAVGVDAYARFRSMLVPLFCLLAALNARSDPSRPTFVTPLE